MPRLLP